MNQTQQIKRPNRFVWHIVLVAFIFRIILIAPVLFTNPEQAASATDAKQYLLLADNLIYEGVFSLETSPPFEPDARRTPGYPLFLVVATLLAGPHAISAALLMHALLGALTAGTITWLGELLFNQRTGIVGGVLTAFAPAFALFTGFASAEVFFSFCLSGSVLLVVTMQQKESGWQAALAGFLLGYAVLVRPIGIMLAPVFIIAMLVEWNPIKKWRVFILFTVCFTLIVGGWLGRNAIVFGSPSLSTISDNNLLYYNGASLEAHRLGIPLEESRLMLSEEASSIATSDGWPTMHMKVVARRTILQHPFAFIWYNGIDALNGLRPGISYMLSLYGHQDAFAETIDTFRHGSMQDAMRSLLNIPPGILLLAFYSTAATFTIVILGVIGLGLCLWRRDWFSALLLGGIPLVLLYLPGIASNARFRAPTEPFLALLAATTINMLWEHLPRPRNKEPHTDA